MKLDWLDIALHVGASVMVIGVFWFTREAIQYRRKYGHWAGPWRWSLQKNLEWIVPMLAAGIVMLISYITGRK